MIYIAHRGLCDGPNETWENHPDHIKQTLASGFDCEIDARLLDGKWWLGHDAPTYEVNPDFFMQDGLWIHCKNHQALFAMRQFKALSWEPNFFWHDTDAYTITSRGYLWTYPFQPVDPNMGIVVQPEWENDWLQNIKQSLTGIGVCSKFVRRIKEELRG